MDSIFKLAVAAIITAAILYAALNYFSGGAGNGTIDKFKSALDYAEANEGRLHSAEIYLEKGVALKAELLDTVSRNARFECSGIGNCSGEKIGIGPRRAIVNESALYNIHFRCKKKLGISDCVTYFGEKPAQLEISNIQFKDKLNEQESATLAFEVKNIGRLSSIGAGYEIKVFEKKKDGPDGKKVLKQNFSGGIGKLNQNESIKISRQFSTGFQGEYLLEIIADGEDSGIAFAEKKFTVVYGTPAGCIATTIGPAVLDNGMCKTQYWCTGCGFGFECKAKWIEKGVSGEVAEAYATSIYATSTPQNGECIQNN